jgi:hypothetical protein
MQSLILWQHSEGADLIFRVLIAIGSVTNDRGIDASLRFLKALLFDLCDNWYVPRIAMENTNNGLMKESKEKEQLENLGVEADDAERNFKEIECEVIDGILLDQDRSSDRSF